MILLFTDYQEISDYEVEVKARELGMLYPEDIRSGEGERVKEDEE